MNGRNDEVGRGDGEDDVLALEQRGGGKGQFRVVCQVILHDYCTTIIIIW